MSPIDPHAVPDHFQALAVTAGISLCAVIAILTAMAVSLFARLPSQAVAAKHSPFFRCRSPVSRHATNLSAPKSEHASSHSS